MKTAITCTNDNLEAQFDLRFGRAAWFCIYNEETEETTFIQNNNIEANSGAGTSTSEQLIKIGVKKVISGDFGPKAKKLLEKFKVQMVIIQNTEQTMREIIDRIRPRGKN